MAHELARRPASMFDDRGAMEVANLKVPLARRRAEGWKDVHYCGSSHRLHAKLGRIPQHLPSSHPAMWNPVISTICSTDARKAVPIIQPEMTEINEPTDSTRVYSLSSTAKLPS